ncbi:MAG: hypothetical protein IJ272_05210 [Clostridia bacterium]|nr:hypothetical protein [Clostridia bacterium]
MEKVVLKHERLLVNLFYHLLSKGITKPVTEKQYFSIVSETLKRINQAWLSTEYIVEDESFQDIVAKANTLARCTRNGIEIYRYRGYFVAKATYDLAKPSYRPDVQINWWPRQQDVFHSVIDARLQGISRKVQSKALSNEQLSVAKKVAALFVNEIVKKYVDRAIEKNRWPSQCKDADEYIFKRDIARYIDEKGTAEIFYKLYGRAIQTVCDLIRENKGSFRISNRDRDLLAFANYLRFFDSEELKFLTYLKHDEYKMHDLCIRCTISDGEVSFNSLKCIYNDSFDGDNTYERKQGQISEKEVEIMEKRMAYLKG